MNPRPLPLTPRPGFLALTSVLLLVLAFPPFAQPWAAWVALVPWLVLLRERRGRAAFWWSYTIGIAFFLGSIWWLIHVTLIGWILLCAYLALFFGAFGWLARVGLKTSGLSRGSWVMGLVSIPSAWVALEYLRSHLLSGFGWNLLAYSQTPWPTVLQLADVTGAWGISFAIVLVNVALAAWVLTRQRRWFLPAAAALAMLLGYGAWRVPRLSAGPAVRLAVVQGNIPQEHKWDEAYQGEILHRYETLTRLAAQDRPDLIVWPETSVPGYLGLEDPLTPRMTDLARAVQVPLLVGAPRAQLEPSIRWRMTNAAALLSPDGAIAQWHEKLHLVPFGEFIPLERYAPWLRAVLPPIGDFMPGHARTVFSTPVRFSVLICFEDIFPELGRRFVREGARLLVVITNDAWFGPTAAAHQHTQASILRAVELRVPVARAANTGWSGCIDASGRILGSVHDAAGRELFVEGTHLCELRLGDTTTPYARLGDWLPLVCLLATLVWALSQLLQKVTVTSGPK